MKRVQLAVCFLLAACAQPIAPPEYPKEWMLPQTADAGCPDLTGVFSDSRGTVRVGKRARESDSIWRLATSLGVNAKRDAEYDSIVGPKNGQLTVTTWSGDKEMRSRTLVQTSDYSCVKGWMITWSASSYPRVL
ncbi:MAG TPA: hypothetical protein VEE84_06880, partial [Burkholderiaceae bacterium]|nr:hypothetical protein [Burkholderiaceae bacterium]